MDELNKNAVGGEAVNEVDVAEMVAKAQEEDRDGVGGGRERKRILEGADVTGGKTAKVIEDATHMVMLREVRRARSRRRWGCVGLAILSAVTVMSCRAALMTGRWQETLYSIGIIYLVMTAVWLAEAWNA